MASHTRTFMKEEIAVILETGYYLYKSRKLLLTSQTQGVNFRQSIDVLFEVLSSSMSGTESLLLDPVNQAKSTAEKLSKLLEINISGGHFKEMVLAQSMLTELRVLILSFETVSKPSRGMQVRMKGCSTFSALRPE
nr:MAG: hypothetical protein [Halyomorpha halys orthomyxo-like virus 1]